MDYNQSSEDFEKFLVGRVEKADSKKHIKQAHKWSLQNTTYQYNQPNVNTKVQVDENTPNCFQGSYFGS